MRQKEISEDPVIQLKRSTSKLIKFNYVYNENFTSEGKVIFPNSEFFLESDHPTLSDYVVFRHQLRRYLYSLNELKVGQRAVYLTELIKKHIVENPYFDYSADFNTLRKGVYCRKCGSYDLKKSRSHFQCQECRHLDTIHTIIVQSLSDFNILFNQDFIHRQILWEFLGGQIAHSTLNKYLIKYCIKINGGPATKYKFKYIDFNDALKNEIRVWRYKDMPLKS